MDYKLLLGIFTGLLVFYGYYSYIISVLKQETKPHIFSWLIWTFSTMTVFLGSFYDGGGVGTIGPGLIAFFVFFIFLLSLKFGSKKFNKIDIFSLIIAIFALFLWYLTNTPLYSIIFLTILDIAGFIPTFKKTYHSPFSETVQIYFITGTIYLFSIISLEKYSLITLIGPIGIGLINFLFVFSTLFWRRKKK